MFFSARLAYGPQAPVKCRLYVSHDKDAYKLLSTDGSIEFTLAKRNSYPATYCRQIDADTFQMGYGDPEQTGTDEEFLHITVSTDGSLRITRDAYATLPLFYGHYEKVVHIANDYEQVVAALPKLTLNLADLAHVLLPHTASHPTLWKDIHTLEERQVLDIDSHGHITKQLPQPRTWRASNEVSPSDPTEFVARLEAVLHSAFTRYAPSGTGIGFELSGGLDSSLFPLYLSKVNPETSWQGITVLLPEQAGATQTVKLAAIHKRAPAAKLDVLRPAARHYPLAMHLGSPQAHLFYPKKPVYYEQCEALAQAFQANGVRVVFSGFGGDDLFEHIADANAYLGLGQDGVKEQMEFFTPYFTQSLAKLARDSVRTVDNHRPLPLLSVSVSEPSLQNNLYIERGMWPVPAFINVSFYEYCQGLPWTFKKDKRLLRAYFQANHFPRVLYDKTLVNEDFGSFFDKAMLAEHYTPFVEYFAREGVTVGMGYVDGEALLRFYKQAQQQAANWTGKGELYPIYSWLCAEINLHAAFNSGQWRPH